MTWRLKPGEPLEPGLRRAAEEELARIRRYLTDEPVDRDKAIHQARRRIKKLRAMLRLLDPTRGESSSAANRHLREAGRRLSASRDDAVRLQRLDELMADPACPISTRDGAALRDKLTEGVATGTGAETAAYRSMQEAADLVEAAEREIADMPFPQSPEGMSRGLRDSQSRLRKSWRSAKKAHAADALHDWRKRLKDQSAQLALFRDVVPNVADRLKEEKAIAEVLGEERDLSLLGDKLADGPDRDAADTAGSKLLALIEERRAALLSDAFARAEAFCNEKGSQFARSVTLSSSPAGEENPAGTRKSAL